MKIFTINFIISTLLLFSSSLSALTEKDSISPIISIEKNVKDLEAFKSEISLQKESILNFKLKFSKLVTTIATTENYLETSQENIKGLQKFEKSLTLWDLEISSKEEKIQELFLIIDQTKTTYLDILKKSKKSKKKRSAKKEAKLLKDISSRIKNLKEKVEVHSTLIKSTIKETVQWKTFLKSKIKKKINKSLLSQKINSFFTSPLETTKELYNISNKELTKTIAQEMKLIKSSKRTTYILNLFFVIIIFSVLYYLTHMLYFWHQRAQRKIKDSPLHLILEIIDNNQVIVASLGFFSIYISLNYIFILDPKPTLTLFVLSTTIFIFVWRNILSKIFDIFVTEINKSKTDKKIRFYNFPVILFIFFKSFEFYFKISNDTLTFTKKDMRERSLLSF